MTTRLAPVVAVATVLSCGVLLFGQAGRPIPRPERKQVLAWADIRNGVQHDSVSRALVTIERLGRESGAYDTYIRTDSQLITKQPITMPGNARPITNKNLDYFDAIFFFGVREIDLTPQQKADLLSFVKDDGKGFVAAHTASTAFFSWPEFGDMLGGRFDEHPWNVTDATVIVEDTQFPAMRHFPIKSVIRDEHYQTKDFSRDAIRVLARLDPRSVDLKNPRVHRTDEDFPVAWAKKYGKGNVFYSTLGHAPEAWDDKIVATMYFEAMKWALGLVPGDATPRPLPTTAGPAHEPTSADGTEWRVHGGDPGGRRFSPLKQITPANVARLQPAWSFDVGSSNLQITPLVIDGQMYVSGGSTIFAIEPERGTAIWKYEAPAPVSRRGVAYWPGDATTPARLFSGAGNRLVALDAKTGRPAEPFGEGGSVDLSASIRGDVDGRFSMQSPPAIYKDLVITGGNNGEQSPSAGFYGDIRAWDARSGRLVWTFHTVPRPGEPGVETWEGESWKNRSGTNMWAFFTVDVERGLVFAPIGSPTSDYYGADRKGKNLYGNSIVALDATTGRLKWYQQLVHHDLWDFDLPAAPTLIDVTRDGKTIPAVAVLTKVTHLFIFDRVTGEPIFGMEERAVPQSTVPGEASWPTQPFPLKPPALGRIDFDPAKDLYSATPEHAAFCKDLWEKNAMYTNGPFTPPALEGMMVTFPSTLGGGNWNGLSYDASLGLAFTNVMNLGQVARMQLRPDRSGQTTYLRMTPWGGVAGRFWNPENKIPCSAPPFGELVAVDVNKGEIAWKVPFGVVDALEARGVPQTGTLSIGGAITTASGVLFIGATIDGRFRAFESKTGRQLWETKLEASAHSIPMTFMGKDNRQYVVVAAGGGSYLGSPPGTKIVAFALPRTPDSAPAPSVARKNVLAWADVRNGYQHESISHAVATIERLGYESGLFDTYIRTDSQPITKRPITFKTGTGIATGEQFLVRNLNYFDAIFFFGVREIDLTPEQRADLLSFVRDDGKGFVTAHSGATAFFSWPEFGEMLGGRFDEHPWGITEATVIVDDGTFPATKHLPRTFVIRDEHYQLKDWSRDKVRVLARLDASKLDLTVPLVHRKDADFPVAWAKSYGKGRVFYSTLGHARENWDNPLVQKMYVEAIKWAIGLTDGS